jgi:Ca2+-binding EF-hand superfamily protein
MEELKRMMEKLQAPQTHLALKAMIKEVDEDGDSKISFREVHQNSHHSLLFVQITLSVVFTSFTI